MASSSSVQTHFTVSFWDFYLRNPNEYNNPWTFFTDESFLSRRVIMVFNFSPPISPPVHLSLTFYFYFKHTSMQPVSLTVTVFVNLINIPYHIRNLSRMSCMVAIRMHLPFYAPGGHGDSPNKDRKCQLPNKHPCMSSSMSLCSEYKFCTFVSPSNLCSSSLISCCHFLIYSICLWNSWMSAACIGFPWGIS